MELDAETAEWYRLGQARSEYGGERWVEYIGGYSPIVICVPHGGLNDGGLLDRPGGCHVHDSYSLELALATAARIAKTSRDTPLPVRHHISVLPLAPRPATCPEESQAESVEQHPHVVISHLSRSKMDPNRDKEAACMGICSAEEAWEHYHGFITTAIEHAWKHFGYAHVFDFHGQSHRPSTLELGYCLTGVDLNVSDDELNRRAETFVQSPLCVRHDRSQSKGANLECTLMTMFHRRCCADRHSCECAEHCVCACCGASKRGHIDSVSGSSSTSDSRVTFADLVRGKDSLGALLSERGFPAVPSPVEPRIEGRYFWGAFTTRAYGLHYAHEEERRRVALEACVNSTQLEPPMYMREAEGRPKFAQALAESIVIWIDHWYRPI